MQILFLAHRVPYPPNKGDKIRSFYELKFLAQRHHVDLACLAGSDQEAHYLQELAPYCRSVHVAVLSKLRANLQAIVGLFSRKPLSLPFFFARELQTTVNRLLQQHRYDVIFVFSSSMAQYIEHVRNIPRVMDFVDVDSEKWRQYAQHAKFPYSWVYRMEGERLRAYEAQIARTFQHCLLVSAKEVDDFRRTVAPLSTISSILNGVDVQRFQPSSEPYDPHQLVFMGAMDYWANVETMAYFVREILPRIHAAIPDVKLYIVGSNPTPEVQRLTSNQPHVIVTGTVEQVQPYVHKSAVFVAPMRIGRGINNKIIEAMAMGVPVVTSSIGFEGIPAIPGKELLVEDEPERFARQVLQLMTDAELRATIAVNAQRVIIEKFDWDLNLAQLEQILLQLTQPGNVLLRGGNE